MSRQELTPVFPAHIKPVRVGVYHTRMGRDDGYSLWRGNEWGHQWVRPGDAAARPDGNGGGTPACQSKEWRGLAADPTKGRA